MKIRNLIAGGLLSISLLTGCTGEMSASAEEVVNQVLESGKKTEQAYYGKAVMKSYEGKVLQDDMAIEEFVKADGTRKVITTDLMNKDISAYALNDGEKLITYEKGSDTAYQIDLPEAVQSSSMTQKEQLTAMLEGIKDTHSYELAGEEKILGFDTYHLKVKANEKGGILGDMEFWIDQKSWFILKSIVSAGDIRSEIIYEEIDFSPEFEKDTFTLDLPADVDIKTMEDEFKSETGTIEDAEKALGEPFLVFDEKDVQLENVAWDVLNGEINRTELNLQYQKDGIHAFSYAVFVTPEGEDAKLQESEYKIRGQITEYWKEINAISWDENGMRYSIIIENPDLTADEVITLAENMKLSSEK